MAHALPVGPVIREQRLIVAFITRLGMLAHGGATERDKVKLQLELPRARFQEIENLANAAGWSLAWTGRRLIEAGLAKPEIILDAMTGGMKRALGKSMKVPDQT